MTIEIFLFVLAALVMLLGIIGCFAPFLPGPPLAYVALLVLHFTKAVEFTTTFLLLWAIVVIVISILDYLIPIWGTKKFGGTKSGQWGAAIGLVLGVFVFPPWGIIIGTWVGAFVGEIAANPNDVPQAMRSALGALAGFALGLALKLTVTLVMTFYLVKEIIKAVW